MTVIPVAPIHERAKILTAPRSFQLVGPLNSDNELLDFAETVEIHTQR